VDLGFRVIFITKLESVKMCMRARVFFCSSVHQGALHQSIYVHGCCLLIAVPALFVACTHTGTGFTSNCTGTLIDFACDLLQRSTAFS